MLTRFSWLRTESGEKLLYKTLGFYKKRKFSVITERLLLSHEEFCSTELVSQTEKKSEF
jgi:hypothetical protein